MAFASRSTVVAAPAVGISLVFVCRSTVAAAPAVGIVAVVVFTFVCCLMVLPCCCCLRSRRCSFSGVALCCRAFADRLVFISLPVALIFVGAAIIDSVFGDGVGLLLLVRFCTPVIAVGLSVVGRVFAVTTVVLLFVFAFAGVAVGGVACPFVAHAPATFPDVACLLSIDASASVSHICGILIVDVSAAGLAIVASRLINVARSLSRVSLVALLLVDLLIGCSIRGLFARTLLLVQVISNFGVAGDHDRVLFSVGAWNFVLVLLATATLSYPSSFCLLNSLQAGRRRVNVHVHSLSFFCGEYPGWLAHLHAWIGVPFA